MPYQHCPDCRLTVRLAAGDAEDGPCPRCGARLGDEPRSLFATAAPTAPSRSRSRRFARTPSPLSPEAVRTMLASRGGRVRGTGPAARRTA